MTRLIFRIHRKAQEIPQSLIVKFSDNVNGRLEIKMDNSIRDESSHKMDDVYCARAREGSELKKYSQRQKILTRVPGPEEGFMHKSNIKFDNYRNTCLLEQEQILSKSLATAIS